MNSGENTDENHAKSNIMVKTLDDEDKDSEQIIKVKEEDPVLRKKRSSKKSRNDMNRVTHNNSNNPRASNDFYGSFKPWDDNEFSSAKQRKERTKGNHSLDSRGNLPVQKSFEGKRSNKQMINSYSSK